jgi:acyl-CoA thioesterase
MAHEAAFDRASRIRPEGPGEFVWDVPPGWEQGRGAWGGLCVAALLAAVDAVNDEGDRPVRSISVELVAPAKVGPVRLTTTLLRRGTSLSAWSAQARDDAGLVGTLTAVRSTVRPTVPDYASWDLPTVPDHPAWHDVPVVPLGPPLAPAFMTHLEMRPLTGLPLEGAAPRTSGWLRLAEPVPHSAATLLALADGWWIASIVGVDQPHSFATVSFAASLLVDPASVPADEPLFCDLAVVGAHDGFSSETRRLWSADGRLLVHNQQTVALIV